MGVDVAADPAAVTAAAVDAAAVDPPAAGRAPADADPVEFDHREAGTGEAVWSAAPELTEARRLHLEQFDQLVVVAAHPDDESLGAGGLLAAATRIGLPVTVVIATLGERSHPNSPSHTADDLRVLRRAEVFQALAAVAPNAVVRLVNLDDGRLAEQQDQLVDALRPLVVGTRPLVVAPWRGDRHPDHQAAGEAAATLATALPVTLLEYPIWAWHWAVPQQLPSALVRFDLTAVDHAAKSAAVGAHHSQTEPLSTAAGDEAIVPPEIAAHFDRDFEIFVATASPPATASLPQRFFEDFYGDGVDPWGFSTRWYEERKRDLTLACLPRQRFTTGFEPGCSIGVLTAELAKRCDRLLATDIAEQPLRIARERLAEVAGVRFERLAVPQAWPPGTFDLIVLSEVAYYCSAADLDLLLDRAEDSLTPDGVLLACHWRHQVAEYPLTGDQVHAALRRRRNLALLVDHTEEDFLLQVYTRPPAVSVATAAGLVG